MKETLATMTSDGGNPVWHFFLSFFLGLYLGGPSIPVREISRPDEPDGTPHHLGPDIYIRRHP